MNDKKFGKSNKMQVQKLPTGIEGFDDVCRGGLPVSRSTLVSGTSGTGKTVFSLQYLHHGICNFDEASSKLQIPWCKYCREKTVLPVPEVPLTSVLRDTGKPPLQTSSKPSMPVGNFWTCILFDLPNFLSFISLC